ncbi:MAG TPA: hypothetical protein VGS21_00690, partial [Acidimicrobiales bacterium]|nr:hypothetical protein [Acidimicrobiales bacterium]
TEPAALFRSNDGGHTFELVRTLWDLPDRESWEPGGGGLALHTILTHPARPRRVIVAISTGGVYRSDDGGKTWAAKNTGIAATFLPDPNPPFGQCVHKVAIDAGNADVLWAQNHGGVYRSEDAGDSWVDVGRPGQDGGLPSDFGFAMIAHPAWPDTAYVFPLESSEYRCSPDGLCRVFRTTNGGASWEPLTEGLPQGDAHMTVLRDAFTIGDADPHVIAFGTRSGEVYASADGGDDWRLVAWHLPSVLCVRVLS